MEAELTCSRCLSPFSSRLTFNTEEEYFPTVDVVSGASLPVPDEPGRFTINEQHVLDLTEVMRQYSLVATPIKPLCREDCAGLCPQCGRNLSLGQCDCLSQQVDPRWSELTKLLSEQKGKE